MKGICICEIALEGGERSRVLSIRPKITSNFWEEVMLGLSFFHSVQICPHSILTMSYVLLRKKAQVKDVKKKKVGKFFDSFHL